MSQVLVIEPHKMLQQALALVLVQEHQVRFFPALPADAIAGEFDVVIVDVAALEETAAPVAQTLATVLGWQVPTILIEGAQGAPTSEHAALVRLRKPIGKESLRSALAQCLSFAAGASADSAATLAARSKKAGPKEIVKQRKPKGSELSAQERAGLIELVDAIEEDETPAMEKK